MIWSPDTCYCIVECDAPSKNGKFIKRCRVHPSTYNTTDVYAHNLTNRKTGTESDETALDRKRQVKEATRP